MGRAGTPALLKSDPRPLAFPVDAVLATLPKGPDILGTDGIADVPALVAALAALTSDLAAAFAALASAFAGDLAI
jgi:hypothetical protein